VDALASKIDYKLVVDRIVTAVETLERRPWKEKERFKRPSFYHPQEIAGPCILLQANVTKTIMKTSEQHFFINGIFCGTHAIESNAWLAK
jgi:hypothetical protein